nr:NAD-dependent epimerase/dehydratase family protein [Acidobacteriota bacterium]NIQ83769.1 NAD-dependent epimerase/dehydratase family protein [Acidobacteriota bacterium]
MSVLIAGCGYVGGRLARLLVEAGAGVFALSRRPAVLPGVSPVRADLASRGSLIDLPSAFDAIVFCAGPSSHDERGYREIFVDGLSNLIEVAAAMRQPPDRLIFASSTAVYGQSHGEWVDEASSTRPLRFNGEVLLEAESLLHDAPFAGCALRLGGIYGPGRTRRIEQVRAGQVRLDPGGPHYTNRIHLEDAARSLMHLLAAPALEPVYLGVDDEPADDNDVLRFLAGELGLPDPPVAASAVARRSGSKRCRNDRLKASGYRLAYPTY